MKITKRQALSGALLVFFASFGAWWCRGDQPYHYLPSSTGEFVAQFAAPSAADSAQTHAELTELLELQRTRSAADVTAARADRTKDVSRFLGALGLDEHHADELNRVRALTDRVESDIGPYVRAAKKKFQRLRPYEIEPELKPCIDDVKGDQSYPSGHATYGYVMGELLAQLVPERRAALEKRADEYARQRMVCGIHFRSDLDAGRKAAQWLTLRLAMQPAFQRDLEAARVELRNALRLPPRPQ